MVKDKYVHLYIFSLESICNETQKNNLNENSRNAS